MANTTGKKFGGRQKGTPNRLTRELRAVLKDLIHEELEALQEKLDHLDPKERLEVLVKLLPYVLPMVSPAFHTLRRMFRLRFGCSMTNCEEFAGPLDTFMPSADGGQAQSLRFIKE